MDESEIIRRAQKLIKRFDNMRIIGSRGEWSGSARLGFNFNPQRGGGGSTGGGTGPPPVQTGACCLDGECSVTTQVACTNSGGIYMGNGTDCADQNCPQETSGACCVVENCSIETPEHCEEIGGVYQGDDTICEMDTCQICGTTVIFLCKCGFQGFVDSTKYYLSSVTTHLRHDDTSISPGPCTCELNSNAVDTSTVTFDEDFNCETNTVYSGGATYETGGPPPCTNDSIESDYIAFATFDPPRNFCHVSGLCQDFVPAPCDDCIIGGGTTQTTDTYTCERTDADGSLSSSITQELSNEYTTEMLIDNALSLLGECDLGCSQTYMLNEDESCVTAWCIPDPP